MKGGQKNDLNNILKVRFKDYQNLEYHNVIADTYYLNHNSSFDDFVKLVNKEYYNLRQKYKKNKLLKKFSFKEIFIIGSLLEKEGIDYIDKKNIYSVIANRLNKNIKLQIDATVIYALTGGKTKLNRKLTYDDLKIKNKFNTYYIYGLPPEPISYVGLKTIDLIFENYNTDYLFYFYNSIENKHVYSKNYKRHLIKLNEYRSKK